nr:prophage tail fiber N-terminal domain-containing protein [Gilliamella apicola]
MAKISGILTDGAGQIINNCTIELYAKKTTNKVLTQTQAFQVADNGSYMMNVLPCDYDVKLIINGFPPKRLGTIQVFSDSKDGSLNDFLLNPLESEITPEVLQQVVNARNAAKKSADDAKKFASTIDTSQLLKKSGDEMTGQLRMSAESAGIKFKYVDSNNEFVLRTLSNSLSFIFYDEQIEKWSTKLAYITDKKQWCFLDVDDVTINNKSVLKTGDAVQLFGDLANTNINNLTGFNEGIYFQGKNVQATSENNYPINEAGTLQVLKNGADGAGCCQIYTAYRNARQFIRNYRGGSKSWEPWIEQITTANVDNFLPVGIPQPWPTATPPAGWLKCNGWKFDKNKYPKLANAYPSGFLPEMRGETIRGWDDGRGVDPGRQILSWQGDAIRNIWGEISPISETFASEPTATGAFKYFEKHAGHTPTSVDRGSVGGVVFDASNIVPTANENRVRSVAFLYIVKAE